jgi:hypothetical protein
MVAGLGKGYMGIVHEIGSRRPVRRRTYLLSRMLRAKGCVPLEEIEGRLEKIEVMR